LGSKTKKAWYRKSWVWLLFAVACLVTYLALQVPGNEGPWREDQEQLAHATWADRTVTLHNIRDFRYDSNGTATSKNYISADWNLDELERLWFGLSHFGPAGLAHSFISIEFTDGRYLTFSIEGRLRPGQGYNPIVGLFRQYTKIFVVGTEQDIIGLRSHRRGETVLLYPVSGSRDELERFFTLLLDDAIQLYQEPEFYNTILDNCLTNLLKHGARLSEVSSADFRVLLPGHTDRLTYAFDITPSDIPFESARNRALVDPSRSDLEAPDFSSKIRCGWDGYGEFSLPECR
jgi:hypothetical protein